MKSFLYYITGSIIMASFSFWYVKYSFNDWLFYPGIIGMFIGSLLIFHAGYLRSKNQKEVK
jgi:hypothetical protein